MTKTPLPPAPDHGWKAPHPVPRGARPRLPGAKTLELALQNAKYQPAKPGEYCMPPRFLQEALIPDRCPCCARTKFAHWREWEEHLEEEHDSPETEWARFCTDFWPWAPYQPWGYTRTEDGKFRPVVQGDRYGVKFHSEAACQQAIMASYWGHGGLLRLYEEARDRVWEKISPEEPWDWEPSPYTQEELNALRYPAPPPPSAVDPATDYETQGKYPRNGARKWGTHMKDLSLEQARHVYTWFKRLCQDPDWDSPNDARIVQTSTGQVVPPPELETPVKLPGHRVRTVAVTEDEWRESTRYMDCLHKRPHKNGGYVYTSGRDYVLGYQMPDGTYRVRPGDYKPAQLRKEEMRHAA